MTELALTFDCAPVTVFESQTALGFGPTPQQSTCLYDKLCEPSCQVVNRLCDIDAPRPLTTSSFKSGLSCDRLDGTIMVLPDLVCCQILVFNGGRPLLLLHGC
jgi:hypothetical protein